MTDRISTDDLRRLLDNSRKHPMADYHLENIAPQLAAEVIELREALEPFAKVAEHDIGYDEADTDVFRPMMVFNHAPRIRVGDLRRARAALNHKETE